jgi:outer membrane protein assembly factor BamB
MKRFSTINRGVAALLLLACTAHVAAQTPETLLERVGTRRGIVALVDLPQGNVDNIIELAKASELTVLFQSDQKQQVDLLRRAADKAGLLGTRIFVVNADNLNAIKLADNVADAVFVAASATERVSEAELLRVIQPRASVFLGDRKLVKPVPEGADDWSHPYHGPDNNPLSQDTLVRGNFQTQFIGYPKFSPMPEQSVVAGGRIFKAMGHIAHKANQNEMLNTLLCINAYNGTILWKRPSSPGFMIHRNTMIATEDALYMGDHESCKIFDAKTGKLLDQIIVDPAITDGPVWKWMAIQGNVLYALVGNPEISVTTQRSARRGLGHWPWGMWEGHDYKDPRTAFGFGRTLVAIDLDTKKPLWHYRDEEFLDARAVCMTDDRIFCFCPEKFLLCISAQDGKVLWKNTDEDLLAAIGPNGRAQHYVTGYATTCYMKCSDNYVFFAGPQRQRLVVASTANGKLAWTYPIGNLQIVLRDDAMWAAGPQDGKSGVKLDYGTGNVLAEFPARRACTRATGCADSIFFRATGGTVRVMTETNNAQHFDPMRPPCQDGVIVSNGHLYWGPWMCGCELSLYGNICLRPESKVEGAAATAQALTTFPQALDVKPLEVRDGDWPIYRADNARSDVRQGAIPSNVHPAWKVNICSTALPTAPVAAGGMVFVADRTGAVQAFDHAGKSVWKSYTGGPVYYPPTIAHDRLFLGSADGNVYALEARTGRKLWQYRVGPVARRIPVYGDLISQYPVSGGVVVQDDTVYAAAGITHYDGTYVVALDARTGEVKARNDTSGVLDAKANNGISLQGNLKIVDGQLRFLAGGVYETARYDLATLKCLNQPVSQVFSQFRTAFYPYYPAYGKFVSLDYTLEDGHLLNHDASYEGSLFSNLSLQNPLPAGQTRPQKQAARWLVRRGQKPPETVWRDRENRRFTSFVVCGQTLLATGHPDASPDKPFLVAINITNGSDLWLRDLPAVPVKGGCAIDHDGQIYLALENGTLVCLN